ncbi:MAG TPA: gamma-glutamyl-gamma-aminobutyrate hydrolase family protein [Thermoanaerobaculia bacterium]|nr:gamma-glutamyl-gamma-aminobutyrate hydrolase family protein [Thermoanaerobaculia bacterium]
MTSPLIAIAADIAAAEGRERASVPASYIEAVRRAGGMPLLVPPGEDGEAAAVVGRADALLLVGGNDCDPALFGEEPHPSIELIDPRRQRSDLALAAAARRAGLPTLGICLGMQIMNVAAGGTLIQDIPSQVGGRIPHGGESSDRARHAVTVDEGSRLAALIGAGRHDVNSTHHQAVRAAGSGIALTAVADDGVVEALEDPAHPFYLGVQWHPEDMAGERAADPLFEAFIAAARERAKRGARG